MCAHKHAHTRTHTHTHAHARPSKSQALAKAGDQNAILLVVQALAVPLLGVILACLCCCRRRRRRNNNNNSSKRRQQQQQQQSGDGVDGDLGNSSIGGNASGLDDLPAMDCEKIGGAGFDVSGEESGCCGRSKSTCSQ
jgi:hypothetical protein